jgi:hypothetical protein
MIELSGTPPERLPPARDITKVKGDLKRAGREYARLDEQGGTKRALSGSP